MDKISKNISKPLETCLNDIRADLSQCHTEARDLEGTLGKCRDAFNMMASEAELPFLNRARETIAVLLDTTVQRMYGNHLW